MKIINWGIIGAGKIASKFAEDLSLAEHTQLYAIASSSKERAEDFALKHNSKKSYDSYETMLKDPLLDAVYIATPHSFHKQHTLLCLKHKKAVLCEKPFAMNLKEVNEMIETSKTQQTLLMEAMWTAFLPHFKAVKKLLEKKHFGEILKLEADFGFNPIYDKNSRVFKKSLGGGSLLDIGIYPIFIALETLGKPDSVEANAIFYDSGADAQCDMVFNYKNAIAILKSTFREVTATEAIFYCENGIIKIKGRFHEPSSIELTDAKGKFETIEFNTNAIGYYYEIEHFNALLRNGLIESPLMTFKKSQELITTLDAVREKIGLSY